MMLVRLLLEDEVTGMLRDRLVHHAHEHVGNTRAYVRACVY
jgi:hypothetical protein